uniref:Uncharacterized protein n=1 Tax=Anguilla anguilla TaxID=7936 RepID=A0A0E9QLS3_ANGAN
MDSLLTCFIHRTHPTQMRCWINRLVQCGLYGGKQVLRFNKNLSLT